MKILFLVSKYYHEKKMSRARFSQMDAVGELPGVELRHWGKGWYGYDEGKTLDWNIRESSWKPDVIHLYKPEDHRDVGGCRIPKVLDFNEANVDANAGITIDEIRDNNVGLVVCHHANDIPRLSSEYPHAQYWHIPHCAAPVYEASAKPWAERSTEILLTGVCSPDPYPLRHKFKTLIESGRIKATIRTHPGYRLAGREKVIGQNDDYASALGDAKFVICTASRYNYALAKYPEAAVAGALIIGDVPTEYNVTGFNAFIGRINPEWNDDRIVKAVEAFVENATEKTAEQSAAFARLHYSICFYASSYFSRVAPYASKAKLG